MLTSFERRRAGSLRVHALAAQLLGRDFAPRFPTEADTEQVEILPDGTVVTGARTVLRAKRSEELDVRVLRDRTDEEQVFVAELASRLADADTKPRDRTGEDQAFIAGLVVKNVLAGTKDPIALGTAWAAFRRFVGRLSRPRKGYKHDCYVRRHKMSAAERLAQIIRDTFGCSDDQLRRMEAVLALPVELHDALRTGRVALKALVELAGQPRVAIAAVAADVRAGAVPSEALTPHLPPRDKRPEPRTVVRRLLRAGDEAWTDLHDRTDELGYLADEERTRALRLKGRLDTLLGLPTKGKVLADMLAVVAGCKTQSGAGR